jgi:uncharacterized protein (TIGR03435 family)
MKAWRAAFLGVSLACGLNVCAEGGAAWAQAAAAPAAKPQFDVASVKLSPPPEEIARQLKPGQMPKIGQMIDGLRVQYSLLSLRDLIGIAYGVKSFQVSGPDWMTSVRLQIEAKMPEGASKDQVPAMLAALLAERFHLEAHRSTEDRQVNALVVGKGGPRLTASTTQPEPIDPDAPLKPGQSRIDLGDGPAILTQNADRSATINMGVKGSFRQTVDMQAQVIHMQAENITMDGVADLLTRISQGPMGGGANSRTTVNLTGLTGYYTFAFDLSLADIMAQARASGMANGGPAGAPSPAGDASDPGGGAGATIASALNSLGLKLESRKAPVTLVIVDHADKTPTED